MLISIDIAIILDLIALMGGVIVGVLLARQSSSYAYRYYSDKPSNKYPDDVVLPGSLVVRKEISLKIVSNTLVSPMLDNELMGVEIRYKGKLVKDARLIVLRISNTGNAPILPQDYELNNPMIITFGENAELLDVEILDTTPDNLRDKIKAVLEWSDKGISLGPITLHSSHSITLKLLLTQFQGEIDVKARIAGVKQIYTYPV